LQRRVDRDQEARRSWLLSPSDRELANRVDDIDSENLAWLRNLIAGRGFPTATDVGDVGELSPTDFARYTDRVLLAMKKPQRYGTQFGWSECAR
jgi:hypothetical protein